MLRYVPYWYWLYVYEITAIAKVIYEINWRCHRRILKQKTIHKISFFRRVCSRSKTCDNHLLLSARRMIMRFMPTQHNTIFKSNIISEKNPSTGTSPIPYLNATNSPINNPYPIPSSIPKSNPINVPIINTSLIPS